MARVRRHMPPDHRAISREHSLGETVGTFDAQGEAEIDDPAILELLAQFPDVFEVVGAAPEPAGPPGPAGPASPVGPPRPARRRRAGPPWGGWRGLWGCWGRAPRPARPARPRPPPPYPQGP